MVIPETVRLTKLAWFCSNARDRVNALPGTDVIVPVVVLHELVVAPFAALMLQTVVVNCDPVVQVWVLLVAVVLLTQAVPLTGEGTDMPRSGASIIRVGRIPLPVEVFAR